MPSVKMDDLLMLERQSERLGMLWRSQGQEFLDELDGSVASKRRLDPDVRKRLLDLCEPTKARTLMRRFAAKSGVELERGGFVDCEFDTCNLANLHAADAALRRVRVSGSRMTGFQWINGVLRDVALHDCRLDLSTFRFCTLTDVVFSGCNLTRADFTNADLRRTRFVDCVLAGVQLSHANLAGTRFTRCELVDVGGVTSMRGAVVEGHNLIALAHTLAAALGIVIDPDD